MMSSSSSSTDRPDPTGMPDDAAPVEANQAFAAHVAATLPASPMPNLKPALTTWGHIRPGWWIPDQHWRLVPVLSVTPVHTPKQMRELVLVDGRTLRASGDHLWYAVTSEDKAMYPSIRHQTRTWWRKLDQVYRDKITALANSDPYQGQDVLFPTLTAQFAPTELRAETAEVLFHAACAVGPTSYTTLTDNPDMCTYTPRLIAKQVLAVVNHRWWWTRPTAKIGRVVTTEELYRLFANGVTVTIPVPDSPPGMANTLEVG